MKQVNVKLIDKDDKQVGQVSIVDLDRKPTQHYARRRVILMGKKFIEPEAKALDFAPADEWHEVTA